MHRVLDKPEVTPKARAWLFAIPPTLLLARLLVPSEFAAEVVYLLAPALSVALLVRRWVRDAPGSTAWGLLTLGFGALFAAELYWFAEDQFDFENYPGPGEYASAASLVILTLGLWRSVVRVAPVGDRTGIIDSTSVALAAAAVGWVFIVEPASTAGEMSADEQTWVALLWGLDVALLAVLVRLAFSLRVRPPAYLFLYLGAGGLVALDGGEGVLELSLNTELGPVGDYLEMAAYSCFGLAAVCSDELHRTSASALRYIGVRRIVVLGASALVPLLAETLQPLLGLATTPATAVVLGGAGLAIGALVMVRMAGLIATVRQLADERGRERFTALVEHSSDVVLTVDDEHRIRYASPALQTLWGHRPAAVLGQNLTSLFPAPDAQLVTAQLERAALPGQATLEFESVIARSDHSERSCEVIVANLREHPAVRELVVTLRDITERKELERQLTHQAFHDSLTGLANRALFLDRVEHALRVREDRPGAEVAVIFIDLDGFKQVNDGLGHAAGDDVLEAVGLRLRQAVRSGDTVARLGGDEFVVLLESRAGLSQVLEATERILHVFELPLRAGKLDLAVRASAGAALARPGDTAQDLVQHADIAMYEAKGAGVGGYALFDPDMKRAAAQRIALRSDLDRAIEEKQFWLAYQPIVELRSGRVKGAEALLRWQHPVRGPVSPEDFVPIAEQSGRIVEIGQWVLANACLDAASWQGGSFPVTVNVNVSAVQLRESQLIDRVSSALRAARLAPELLTLEITETAMMEDPETTAAVLGRLRALGVRIAIDDFGTGYCSLAYLKRFSVDFLKIDRAFVSELKADSENELAHNILHMADCLGVASVAEGIEEEAQLANLRSHGCAFAQGYHLGKPMEQAAFARRLRGRE